MKLVQRAFQIARENINLNWNEVPGGHSNPRIQETYKCVDDVGHAELDDSEVPWCSCFANWAIQKAGGRGTRSAAARSWLRWGKHLDKPEVGCIVVFERGNNGWSGHVAFVVSFDHDSIECLGGNQGNDLRVTTYLRSKVLGYRTSND